MIALTFLCHFGSGVRTELEVPPEGTAGRHSRGVQEGEHCAWRKKESLFCGSAGRLGPGRKIVVLVIWRPRKEILGELQRLNPQNPREKDRWR